MNDQDCQACKRYGRVLVSSNGGDLPTAHDSPMTELIGSLGSKPVLSPNGANYGKGKSPKSK